METGDQLIEQAVAAIVSGKASVAGGLDGLARVTEKTAHFVEQFSSTSEPLIDPLMLMAQALAKSPYYTVPALEAFKTVATHENPKNARGKGNDTEKEALDGIYQNFEKLPRSEVVPWGKYLIEHRYKRPEVRGVILRLAKELPFPLRVESDLYVAGSFTGYDQDTEVQKRALSDALESIEKIPPESNFVGFYRTVSRYGSVDEGLAQRALEGVLKHAAFLKEPSARVDAHISVIDSSWATEAQKQKAANNISDDVSSLAAAEERKRANQYVLLCSQDPERQMAALKGIVDDFGNLDDTVRKETIDLFRAVDESDRFAASIKTIVRNKLEELEGPHAPTDKSVETLRATVSSFLSL
ncbi:MAG: hypothetical protein PHS57_03505 [Alphaproteobacteria bacterium]|nr:hypothetical protein [Alphaproteobacteria bacterium]